MSLHLPVQNFNLVVQSDLTLGEKTADKNV